MMDGSYPPGVAGYMLDDYFRDDVEESCSTCSHYDGDRCMKLWNNADEDYYVPERDDRDPEDYCEDYEYNEEG